MKAFPSTLSVCNLICTLTVLNKICLTWLLGCNHVLQTYCSLKFIHFLCSIDPLYIEDPIDYVNNVGSTCFRIQQIVKVCWKNFLSKYKMGEMWPNPSSMFLLCSSVWNGNLIRRTEFLTIGRCWGPPTQYSLLNKKILLSGVIIFISYL